MIYTVSDHIPQLSGGMVGYISRISLIGLHSKIGEDRDCTFLRLASIPIKSRIQMFFQCPIMDLAFLAPAVESISSAHLDRLTISFGADFDKYYYIALFFR